jgi:uncharacterized membrane protein
MALPEPVTFVIRRAFVVPLGLVVLLTATLMAVSIHQGQPLAKVLFLLMFALPLAVLLVVSAWCRLTIDATGVTARRLLRTRRLAFAAVTALEAVQVRSRVFLTLVAGEDDYLIISNGYARFPELVRLLVTRLPENAVTAETRQLAAAPPQRRADIAMAWFAVVAMGYVLIAQFRW